MFKFMLAIFLAIVAGPAFAQSYPPQVSAINPASKIRVTAGTISSTRAAIIRQVYSGDGLSAPNPVSYVSTFNPAGTSWQGNPNMAAIQEWKTVTSRGLVSRLYRFVPAIYRNSSSGKGAMIVSAGHGQIGTFPPFQSSIQYFVASGYEVWTVDMPLSGLNASGVTVSDPISGNVLLKTHDDLQVLETPSFNPLRLFLEPVTAIVDDLTDRGVTNIGMFGLSGGGWTTAVYMAVDTRVLAGYSFAGSMPVYARSWAPPSGALGDWEQRAIPALGVDYLDLYVLAAQGRRFVNIHNQWDDCCFGGTIANHYNAAVAALAPGYATVIDPTATTHTISTWGAAWMRQDMTLRF